MSARNQKLRLRISAIRGILDEVERMLDQEEGAKIVLSKSKKKPAKNGAKTKSKAAAKAKRKSPRQIDIEDLLPPAARGRAAGRTKKPAKSKARPVKAKKVRKSKAVKRTKKPPTR